MDTQATVLVVDDDAAIIRAMSARLGAVGFDVKTVTSGGAALTALRTTDFDAALIDVHMPDIDGFAVCEHIRKHKRFKDIPVFMLTGSSDGLVRNFLGTLSSTVGADHYITKPCDGKEVAQRIWNAVQNRSAS